MRFEPTGSGARDGVRAEVREKCDHTGADYLRSRGVLVPVLN
jgi:hypothetical protein